MVLLNCGNDSHPSQITPPGSTLTNQFAFIRGGGGTGPTLSREVKGAPRTHEQRFMPHGVGLKPWANDLDPGTDSVVLMNNDGAGGETIVVDQGGWFESIQVTPDGKNAAFVARVTGDSTYWQVFLAKQSGSNTYTITQLTSDAENHYQAQLSADGKTVVFVKDTSQAYLMSSSGGTETLIPTAEGVIVYSPTFTPDGKAIVFEDCWDDTINIVNLDGSGMVVLNNPTDFGRSLDDLPAVSPDGKLITFLSDSDVYVMDINGQNVQQLTTDHMSHDPMFVNKKIVFRSWRDGGAAEIYSMDISGANQSRLTNNSVDEWFQSHD